MSTEAIVEALHPLERRLLPVLRTESDFSNAAKRSGLDVVEATRALQWLQHKGLVVVQEESFLVARLDRNGEKYLREGLPERKFLRALAAKPLALEEVRVAAALDGEEFNISVGQLRRKNHIAFVQGKVPKVSITPQGQDWLGKESLEERFLKRGFPVGLADLDEQERYAFDELKKRKLVVAVEEEKKRTVRLTLLGDQVSGQKLDVEVTGRLTGALLQSGEWRQKKFRAYDVSSVVPAAQRGRKHFVNEAIDYVKSIWLEMGFKEMTGGLVQTAFWDLDALYVPQDHPAREMQDTFYLEEPSVGELPLKVCARVRQAHENGAGTGSTGWGYKFSEAEAKRLLLRTHTTVLSAKVLSELKKADLPAKFFAVGEVFRNETLDWKHLFEFHQVDGIVVDPNANLGHLIGYLRQFYKKMGYADVRVRPAHFPYTEPSLEVEVFHPQKKEWIELGGAGIFRPEVVVPLLGEDIPVLAWGQGLGRIILPYWEISDLRSLYRNDLKQLRSMKTFTRC